MLALFARREVIEMNMTATQRDLNAFMAIAQASAVEEAKLMPTTCRIQTCCSRIATTTCSPTRGFDQCSYVRTRPLRRRECEHDVHRAQAGCDAMKARVSFRYLNLHERPIGRARTSRFSRLASRRDSSRRARGSRPDVRRRGSWSRNGHQHRCGGPRAADSSCVARRA